MLLQGSVTSVLLIWSENDISEAKDFARRCESASSLARISFRVLSLSRVRFKYIVTLVANVADRLSIAIPPGKAKQMCVVFVISWISILYSRSLARKQAYVSHKTIISTLIYVPIRTDVTERKPKSFNITWCAILRNLTVKEWIHFLFKANYFEFVLDS